MLNLRYGIIAGALGVASLALARPTAAATCEYAPNAAVYSFVDGAQYWVSDIIGTGHAIMAGAASGPGSGYQFIAVDQGGGYYKMYYFFWLDDLTFFGPYLKQDAQFCLNDYANDIEVFRRPCAWCVGLLSNTDEGQIVYDTFSYQDVNWVYHKLRIDAMGGDDTILGGYGTDIFLGNLGSDHLWGRWGDDTLWDSRPLTQDYAKDYLYGGDGNDCLRSNAGTPGDQLYGENGDDHLTGGTYETTCYCGPGTDTWAFCTNVGGCENSEVDPCST